MHMRFN